MEVEQEKQNKNGKQKYIVEGYFLTVDIISVGNIIKKPDQNSEAILNAVANMVKNKLSNSLENLKIATKQGQGPIEKTFINVNAIYRPAKIDQGDNDEKP